MSIVERSRVLRPSTRKDTSESYKVETASVGPKDTVRLSIYHESDMENALVVFEFNGAEISGRASIHFKARHVGSKWRLQFSGARPTAATLG